MLSHKEGLTQDQKNDYKIKVSKLIDVNYEIAKKNYNQDGIHFLFYIS